MPSVIVLVKGKKLDAKTEGIDKLQVKGKIQTVSFLTVDNGRATYDLKYPSKVTITFHGNPKQIEYVNNEIVIIIGRIDKFDVTNKEGITKSYELKDPIIILHDLNDYVEFDEESY